MNPYAQRINQALELLDSQTEASWQLVEDLKAILRPRRRPVATVCKHCQGPAVPQTGLCRQHLTEYNRKYQRAWRAGQKGMTP